MLYTCPKCQMSFENGKKTCTMCGYDFEHEFIYNPICPTCGMTYPAGAQSCKADNTRLIAYENFTVKCVRCGASYPPEITICPVDGSSVTPKIKIWRNVSGAKENPQYGYLSETQDYIYPKASLGSRFFASFIDGLCLGLLSLPAAIVLVVSINSKSGAILIFLGLLLLIIPTVYSFIKDGLGNGQSWGKKSLDLMVVDIKTNTPCSIGASLVRNLIAAIPYFNLVDDFILMFNHKGQRAGDMIIHTQVIEAYQYAPNLSIEESLKN